MQGRTQDLELGGGGGAPVEHPGFQRGGAGGGGGRFRSDIRKVWGGGGGGQFASIRNVGGGGGHSASGPIPLGTQKISTCYLGILHTRARMNVKYMPAEVRP